MRVRGEYIPDRTPEKAIKEKLQVLRDFGIVDDDSEEHLRNEMERAIAARPNTHFAACELPWRFVVRLYNRLRRFREYMEKSRKEGWHEN